MKNYFSPLLVLLLLIFLPVNIQAQQASEQAGNKKIELKAFRDKTALEIFKILETDYDLNMSFQSNEKAFKEIIPLPDKKYMWLSEIIELLEENLPYHVLQKNGYIILQKKKLQVRYQVQGVVNDAETAEPLIAATIVIAGKNKGMLTSDDGSFSLHLEPGSYDLAFSYMGYGTEFRHVNVYANKNILVNLERSYKAIGEVKIEKKREFMGDFEKGRTIETIDSRELASLPANNPADVLHARVPGVWASKTSGAPGDHIKIRIRGISSLYASVDPLYVIDGVPVPKVNLNSLGISDLNVNDIESITVLKDASSNAIYGLQGGNGVIIVNTKKGGGTPYIKAQYKTGVQHFDKRYDLNGAHDFLQVYKYSDVYHGTVFFTGKKLPPAPTPPVYPGYFIGMPTEKWQEKIFTRGITSEYQLNSGGSFKGLNYYISGNHYKQGGIVRNSHFTKNSVMVNTGYKFFDKIDLGLNYKGSIIDNTNNLDAYLGNPVIFQGINTSPVYYSSVDSVKNTGASRLLFKHPNIINSSEAPYLIKQMKQKQEIKSNSFHLHAGAMIVKNLFFEFSGSLNLKNYNYRYANVFSRFEDVFSPYESVQLGTKERIAVLNRNFNLKYEFSSKLHQVKTNAGFRNYSDNIHWITPNRIDPRYAESHPEVHQRGSMTVFGEKGSTIRQINSLHGHVNYNYDNRYVLSLAGNWDQLDENGNAFTENFFPSLALSWDIANEPLLDWMKALNSLEVYANWGKAGNYPLNGLARDLYAEPYNFALLRDSELGYWAAVDTMPTAQYLENLANHHMRPELVTEYNFGTGISLFNNRVIFNFNYYNKKNSDLILFRDIPLYYAGGIIMLNIGELESWGREFTFETIPIQSKNFSWYKRFNFSMNKQKITRMDSSKLSFPSMDILMPHFEIKVGEPLGNIIGYKLIGEYDPEDDEMKELVFKKKAFTSHGLLFEKQDTSKIGWTENEKTVIGNSIPDFVFSFHNAFRYKNIQLDITLYGVTGVEKFNATRAATYMSGVNSEVHDMMVDGKTHYKSDYFYQSTYFIEDASFIRLKQLSLSYFPVKKWFGCCIPNISITGENLLTLTNYKGYDPEASIYTNNNFSDNAVDRGAYPIPMGFYLSLGLRF